MQVGRPTEVIEARDIDVPEVGPGEVRVAVAAASVNFGDTARTRGGVATVQIPPPFTLGMDVCGVVEAAGEGAEHWLGRRVVAMTKMSFGGMAEHAICQTNGVFDAPAELDDAEAAAFLLPFHTSYMGLHKRAKLQAGETVLVVGAASGVGTAAIQLGVAAGANVIAIAGGATKGDYCRGLGATASIDHATEDIFDRVMELTDNRGADVVFDLVGGPQTETIWTCVAREGRYLPVGFNGEAEGGLSGKPLRKVSLGNFAVLGVLLSYTNAAMPMRKFGMNPFPPETGAEVHGALCALVTSGAIRPAIGRRISMGEVAQTLEDHEQRLTHGRSVVIISGS
ncbi:MAG: Zn-dependent oxidoreductase [Ilumatobacteraceae bacterium]|nr:Zn-dependent oxidoreductase [Ilumatobacteraceae bacterium]